MKRISSVISRSFLTLAVVGLGLALTPRTASAAFIDFTVVEDGVPGAVPNTLTADKLNGGYTETLSLSPVDAFSGTFTADASATFTAYWLDGAITNDTQISGSIFCANCYQIVATFQAEGTYVFSTCDGDACEIFTGTSGTATAYLDYDMDGVGDELLLTSSDLQAGSGGQVITSTDPITGNFNLVFGSNVLTDFAKIYWPTLADVVFSTTVNGDFDELSGNLIQEVSGDVSAQFKKVAVPEPATLMLLGLGLLGSGVAARRRKSSVRG